jgi:hypothetical protein
MEERRTTARRATQRTLQLQVLGSGEPPAPAQLLEVSQGGAGLEAAAAVLPGCLVRLDFDDELWLGEVVHCCAKGTRWALGIRVEQRLSHLTQLRALMHRLDWGQAQPLEKESVTLRAAR